MPELNRITRKFVAVPEPAGRVSARRKRSDLHPGLEKGGGGWKTVPSDLSSDGAKHYLHMTHREAGLEDCGVLAEMNHQLIRDEGHRNPMTVPELAERMRGWLSGQGYRAILFEEARCPVAYALFRTEPDAGIHLRQFFVARGQRRRGVGSQAVALLFREVFPSDVRVTLDVLADNERGASFWAAAGFRRYAVRLERFNLSPRAV